MNEDHCGVAIAGECAFNNGSFFWRGLADKCLNEVGWGIANYGAKAEVKSAGELAV
jgi:hypothetical protein